MLIEETALLVVDVQESFRHRPYWNDSNVPVFLQHLERLIDGAKSRGIPVVQIFHVEDSGPFSLASGCVVPLKELSFVPDVIFYKRSHSALVGSGLDVCWFKMESGELSSAASARSSVARLPRGMRRTPATPWTTLQTRL
jgi:Isochorismatase family